MYQLTNSDAICYLMWVHIHNVGKGARFNKEQGTRKVIQSSRTRRYSKNQFTHFDNYLFSALYVTFHLFPWYNHRSTLKYLL